MVRPSGYPSEIHIQTFDEKNERKRYGGDSWKVILRGEIILNINMIDANDGSYIGYFLVPNPGKYKIDIILFRSMCSGVTDPPSDWFRKGMSTVFTA